MSERERFIAAVKSSNESFSELCRQFGISRKTGYKWLKRYEEEGPAGLTDRPPVAARIRHKLPRELVGRILEVRKAHPTWGPRKIRAFMSEHHFWRVPAASTIGSILKQYGLVTAGRRSPRRPRPNVGVEPTSSPNETWCIDFKGDFVTGCGKRCYPLTLSDHQTRYLLKCEALAHPNETLVRPRMEHAFHEFGLPDRIRSDNGAPFSSRAVGGLSRLSVWWIKLGILPELIMPGHPEQNGRHERIHRTLKADVPRQQDLLEQQLAFDRFRSVYNELRPHEALSMKPPGKVYRPSRRIMPATVPDLEYPETMTSRKIDKSGRLRFRGSTHVMLSATLANEVVGLEPFDEDRWLLYVGPVRIGCIEAKERNVRLVAVPEEAERTIEAT